MLAVSLDINTTVIGYFRVKKELPKVDKLLSLIAFLNKEEAELFDIDVRKIDFIHHAKQMMYGTGRYYNKLDLLPPESPL